MEVWIYMCVCACVAEENFAICQHGHNPHTITNTHHYTHGTLTHGGRKGGALCEQGQVLQLAPHLGVNRCGWNEWVCRARASRSIQDQRRFPHTQCPQCHTPQFIAVLPMFFYEKSSSTSFFSVLNPGTTSNSEQVGVPMPNVDACTGKFS